MSEFMQNSLAEHPDFVIFSNALNSLLTFGVPAFLFAYLAHPAPAGYLGLHKSYNSKQWKWVILIAIGLVPLVTVMGSWVNELNLGATAKRLQELRDNQINAYLKNADTWDLLRNLVLLAVLPAFCEELLFRGVVQKFVYSYWKSAWGAVFISAFAFALMHMSLYDFLPIFLAGLALAWIYQQTGCLWLNVTVHCLFNALQVVFSFWALHDTALNNITGNTTFLWVFFAVGLVILFLSLKKLYNLRSPFPKDWSVEEFPVAADDNFNS